LDGTASTPCRDLRENTLELTVAGGVLLAAALSELLFHRVGWVLGLYSSLGADDPLPLAALAAVGRLAVNLVAVLALAISLPVLARITFDHCFGPWPARVLLAGLATGGLVVSSVSIFLALPAALVLGGYVFAAGGAVVALLVAAAGSLDGGRRRIALGLALVVLLPAVELTARATGLHDSGGKGAAALRWSYLLAEVLIVAVPIFAFFTLNLGRLRQLARHPPWPALGAALVALAVALAAVVRIGDPGHLSVVANRILGITIALPARPVLAIYLTSLFLGALLVGVAVLPRGRRWPEPATRRTGLGLALMLIAGLQPSSPYLFSSMLLGALLVGHGLIEGANDPVSRVQDDGRGAKDERDPRHQEYSGD
jgi:hypothetical protein